MESCTVDVRAVHEVSAIRALCRDLIPECAFRSRPVRYRSRMRNPNRIAPAPVRRALFAALLTGLVLVARAYQEAPSAAPAAVELATVVLVRHAEKATDDPRNPSLSPAGQLRAEGLATLLGAAQPTALIASEYKRTHETLAPLAQRTGREITARPARDVAGLVAALRAAPAGSLTVVAGHSNTVPAIARGLGVELASLVAGPAGAGPVLDEAVYDRVYVLTYPVGTEGPASAVELRVPELRGAEPR